MMLKHTLAYKHARIWNFLFSLLSAEDVSKLLKSCLCVQLRGMLPRSSEGCAATEALSTLKAFLYNRGTSVLLRSTEKRRLNPLRAFSGVSELPTGKRLPAGTCRPHSAQNSTTATRIAVKCRKHTHFFAVEKFQDAEMINQHLQCLPRLSTNIKESVASVQVLLWPARRGHATRIVWSSLRGTFRSRSRQIHGNGP